VARKEGAKRQSPLRCSAAQALRADFERKKVLPSGKSVACCAAILRAYASAFRVGRRHGAARPGEMAVSPV